MIKQWEKFLRIYCKRNKRLLSKPSVIKNNNWEQELAIQIKNLEIINSSKHTYIAADESCTDKERKVGVIVWNEN